MTLTIMLVASRAGKLVSQFGVRTVLGSGLIMLTAGMLLFTRIADSGSAIVYVLIPGVLTAAGIAMSIVPSTIAATQGAKEGQAGPRLGPREHLPSGRRRSRARDPDHARHAAHHASDRHRPAGLPGAHRRLPPGLPDRRGPGRDRGGDHVHVGPHARRRDAAAGPALRRWPSPCVLAGFIAVTAAFAGSHGAPIGAYTTRGAYSFVTEPSLHPPMIRSTAHAPASELAPGYIFTANFYDLNEPPIVGQSGPLILDRNLRPVWFQPVPEKVVASNLSLQTYEGKPALAWWQGRVTNTGATETGRTWSSTSTTRRSPR